MWYGLNAAVFKLYNEAISTLVEPSVALICMIACDGQQHATRIVPKDTSTLEPSQHADNLDPAIQ